MAHDRGRKSLEASSPHSEHVLCMILQAKFGESTFHALGCIDTRGIGLVCALVP
jgi:hypothetical protein